MVGKDSRALNGWQHGSPGENRGRPEFGFRRKHFQGCSRRGPPRKGIWEKGGLPFLSEWVLHQDTRVGGRITAHWTAAPAPLRSPGLGCGPYLAPSLGQRTLLASITDRPQHHPNDHISATKTSARGKTKGCQEGPCTHPLASGGAGWPSAALPGPEPGAGPPDGVPTVAEGCT